jgi:predicted anti-sigma-YlaC factor YlaD
MNCEQVKPALIDFLLEEISSTEHSEIETHLKNCAPCSLEMNDLKETLTLVKKSEVSEEIPRRVRIVAEPAASWAAFWLNPARLAFAASALLSVTFILVAVLGTTFSYRNGNFQIAFGPKATVRSTPSASVATVAASHPLDRAEVYSMISDAMATLEAERQHQSEQMAKNVSLQMQQRWQHDLTEMAAGMRYFQEAQTVLLKGQVQNQQLVSTLMERTGYTLPAQQ